jgi:hypothetical protein
MIFFAFPEEREKSSALSEGIVIIKQRERQTYGARDQAMQTNQCIFSRPWGGIASHHFHPESDEAKQ